MYQVSLKSDINQWRKLWRAKFGDYLVGNFRRFCQEYTVDHCWAGYLIMEVVRVK